MISFELTNENRIIQVCVDDSGINALIRSLEKLRVSGSHIHLCSPPRGKDLSDKNPWGTDAISEVIISHVGGYGLKDVCKHPKLVNYQWNDTDSGSQCSIVQFTRYQMADGAIRTQIKTNILTYNFDDVMATRMLELWLKSLPSTVPFAQSA